MPLPPKMAGLLRYQGNSKQDSNKNRFNIPTKTNRALPALAAPGLSECDYVYFTSLVLVVSKHSKNTW